MNAVEKPLNVNEAAEFLGTSTGYVYNLVFQKRLTAYKPSAKLLRFKPSDLEKFVYGNKKSASHELSEKADQVLTKGKK